MRKRQTNTASTIRAQMDSVLDATTTDLTADPEPIWEVVGTSQTPCNYGEWTDFDKWHPEPGANTSEPQEACGFCPFQSECLAWGLHHELEGIWGGLTKPQRIRARARLGITLATPPSINDSQILAMRKAGAIERRAEAARGPKTITRRDSQGRIMPGARIVDVNLPEATEDAA